MAINLVVLACVALMIFSAMSVGAGFDVLAARKGMRREAFCYACKEFPGTFFRILPAAYGVLGLFVLVNSPAFWAIWTNAVAEASAVAL